jgi:RNA polymerase sigma factor (sigma-70 family)
LAGCGVGIGVADELSIEIEGSAREFPLVSLESLFRSEYASTVRLAHLLIGDPVGAEDVAQEAFARVRRKVAVVDNPSAYLRTTTVNLCRNWHRRRRREQRGFERHGVVDVAVSDAAAELLDVVDRLPFRQRAVLVLRYWSAATEAEIASTLGCRPGTVKSLHSRALETLRQEIER